MFLPGACRPLDEAEEVKKLRMELESESRRQRLDRTAKSTPPAAPPRSVVLSDEDSSDTSESGGDDDSDWLNLGAYSADSWDIQGKRSTVYRSYSQGQEVRLVMHKPNELDASQQSLNQMGNKILSFFDRGEKPNSTKKFPAYFIQRGLPQPPSGDEGEETFRDIPRPPSLIYEYRVVSEDYY